MEAVISIVGSILGSLAGKASDWAVDPIGRRLGYLFNHKSKFQNLKDQRKQLEGARERVQQAVSEAQRNGEEIFADVNGWLINVNGKFSEEAVVELEEDEEKAKKKCFPGFCPNFKSRYQLSKKADKEANSVAELLRTKDQFTAVSYRPAPQGTATRPVKDYVAFDSRTRALDEVMEALKDDDLSMIGVYGMGGVGKTTLAKQVARQAKEENLFDAVVMAVVTQTVEIKKIQDQLADELGLKCDEQSESGRASGLLQRLKKDHKVLVILDDIWKSLDLESIGIPSSKGEHQGCKILMTSRDLSVLSLMGSQKCLAIDVLGEEEGWNLFKEMAGDIVQRPDLNSMAIEVSKKCAGLPVALVTVGKAMKNKEQLFQWRDALRQLSRPSERNFKGIPANAYLSIELSYKNLEDEEHQPTFLLCSLMGHDAAIEDLVQYGVGLGLFHGVNTMEETRDRVFALVSSLKTSCLLLDGSKHDRFDMHDVVCDVAMSIASRDHHWLTSGGEYDGLKEWPDKETMKKCELFSLEQNGEVSGPIPYCELECPNLTFFSLWAAEGSSLKIPDNFFKGMQRLKVLELVEIPSLPSSIVFLNNLRTLCLFGCDSKDIMIIGELKNLEVLDLSWSKVEMLPSEIGQLSKLKLLDLNGCGDLKIISPNVLSRLSRLEELYLWDSFDGWEAADHDDEKPRSNASLVELQHLSYLSTLKVHIPDERTVPKDDTFFGRLERYKISIGCGPDLFDDSESLRWLKLGSMNQNIHIKDGVKILLKKGEILDLENVEMVHDVLTEVILSI